MTSWTSQFCRASRAVDHCGRLDERPQCHTGAEYCCQGWTSYVLFLIITFCPEGTSALSSVCKKFQFIFVFVLFFLNKAMRKDWRDSVNKYHCLLFLLSPRLSRLGRLSQAYPSDPWPQVIREVLGCLQAPLGQGDCRRAARSGWWCCDLSWLKRTLTDSTQMTAGKTSHTSGAWRLLLGHKDFVFVFVFQMFLLFALKSQATDGRIKDEGGQYGRF